MGQRGSGSGELVPAAEQLRRGCARAFERVAPDTHRGRHGHGPGQKPTPKTKPYALNLPRIDEDKAKARKRDDVSRCQR